MQINEFITRDKIVEFIKETVNTVVTALVLTFFIYYVIATPNEVQGKSMEPNIHPQELILTNRIRHHLSGTSLADSLDINYKRNEIIIFKLPGKEAYIKRIIAIPGDRIKISNGEVIVNGEVKKEEYIPEDVPTLPGDFLREDRTVEVPEESFVVMGDNRLNSLDSRSSSVGFVDKKYIIGPAFFRLLPLNELGFIEQGEDTK